MPDDFYPFVDSGEPVPDNQHLTGRAENPSAAGAGAADMEGAEMATFACRIAVYDDMLSTPRVIIIEPKDVRTYLEETTNTVYRCMKEQGGTISLMVIREIVENFIHARFIEPIISVLDGGNTIRFADQGPGITDKERAFEFGVTSADRSQKRYIRGTGAGFPMVQQYLENAGGAISIEDNMGQGTVVTVSVDASRVGEIARAAHRGAAVRSASREPQPAVAASTATMQGNAWPQVAPAQVPATPPYQQPQPPAPLEATGQQPVGAPQAFQQPAMSQQAFPAGAPYGAEAAWGYPYQAAYQPFQQPQTAAAWYAGAGAAGAGFAPQAVPGAAPAGFPYQAAPAPAPGTVPNQAAGAAWPNPQVYVSDRGQQALAYLERSGHAGPTELKASLGSSVATWSRELADLGGAGFIVKQGQKFYLTDLGRAWLQQQR